MDLASRVQFLNEAFYISYGARGSTDGAMANVMNCDIIIGSNFNCAITFTFGLMPLGNDIKFHTRRRPLPSDMG